jgi:hypothetical protein
MNPFYEIVFWAARVVMAGMVVFIVVGLGGLIVESSSKPLHFSRRRRSVP